MSLKLRHGSVVATCMLVLSCGPSTGHGGELSETEAARVPGRYRLSPSGSADHIRVLLDEDGDARLEVVADCDEDSLVVYAGDWSSGDAKSTILVLFPDQQALPSTAFEVDVGSCAPFPIVFLETESRSDAVLDRSLTCLQPSQFPGACRNYPCEFDIGSDTADCAE